MAIRLPKGFLLGAASAAHQVEGDNTNSNWWFYEQSGVLPKSGLAADHFHRFEEDFTLAQRIGLNAMRISIEWARIEPQPGQWDTEAIAHYRQVLQTMKAHGLTRMVTLQHFTLPQWFAEYGGFEKKKNIDYFVRYAEFVVLQLQDEVDFWLTINETEVYCVLSYVQGLHPPFKKNVYTMWRGLEHMLEAHRRVYAAIKKKVPHAQVGFVKNSTWYALPSHPSVIDKMLRLIIDYFGNHYILQRVQKHTDFIGLNYYFYHSYRLSLIPWRLVEVTPDGPKSDMGWRTYPEGLYYVLKDLKMYNKPIYITENGIANAHDDMRAQYIREHIQSIIGALADGIPVKGYLYWTLTDTYEWHDGYNPKFGLIDVNFTTQQRSVRPSAAVFGEVEYV